MFRGAILIIFRQYIQVKYERARVCSISTDYWIFKYHLNITIVPGSFLYIGAILWTVFKMKSNKCGMHTKIWHHLVTDNKSKLSELQLI